MSDDEPGFTAQFREELLEQHLSLEHKCVSYLPIQTITKILGMTPEAYAWEATRRALTPVIVEEDDCRIKSGAVYCYSAPHLESLLTRFRDVLAESEWPSDSEAFIRAIARDWVEEEHPVMPVIREAFGDWDVSQGSGGR